MRLVLTVALISLLAAPLAAQEPTAKPKIKRQANLISNEEIDQVRGEVNDAYQIVQRLRPQFLRTRGASSLGNSAAGDYKGPRVIVDGSPRGEVSALSQITAMTVKEIRYLSSGDATTQYGTGYDGGAIVVTTR